MSFIVLEQTVIEIDLIEQARTTGWSVADNIAIHESCNSGSIYLDGQPIVTGQSYQVSYRLISLSGGTIGLKPYLGTAEGTARTLPGFYTETLTATGVDPKFRFYSDSDLTMEVFNIRNTLQSTDLKQQNTIAWSEANNKWTSFYTYNPDVAFSLFINLYSYKNGDLYIHRQNSNSRNNFYGTQYKSIFQFTANDNPYVIKTFGGISLQSNMLMITTENGITTSLGQVSDLIDVDFLRYTLDDGVTQVDVYDEEGVYSAGFLRDKNEDIINGSVLKGNYATIELTSVNEGVLKLFSVVVRSEQSYS